MPKIKNINTYIEEYGNLTFFEEDFNEIDNVILSLISYVNLYGIVPEFKRGKITLKEASTIYFSKHQKDEIDKNILAVKESTYLLKLLATTKRYQDLLLYNYSYKVTFDMQFGAVCIMLPNKSIYVSFEGTDNYVSGWKEDFMFSYQYPTNAQREAITYLNKAVNLFDKKVYVGGHSKGGNLALISTMNASLMVRKKIKYVFCNDSPGLRRNEFYSKQYQRIRQKIKMYVPNESVIGMLLRHTDDYEVIKSSSKYILQHDALTWIVEENHFKRDKLSNFSKKIETGIVTWLDRMDDKKREKFVSVLFNILKKAEITDINEFKRTKMNSTLKILKETKNIDKDTRNMMLVILKDLKETLK